ncbi:MAG: glycosyltransferase [Erysipelotrichia bacterium]|nr:glycosyltransferase [Erysipelotrichia bacterium]
MKVLWLTENYPPRRGGMAQACDRIVNNLRLSGLTVDVVFFSNGVASTRIIQQQNGCEIFFSTSDSAAHDLNCLFNILTNPVNHLNYTHIVAFGGNLPIIALPVFSAWLNCIAITMFRGNDFDLGIFSPQRRIALSAAIEASKTVCVLTSELKTKISQIYPTAQIRQIANGIDTNTWQAEAFDRQAALEWRAANIGENKLVIGLFGQFKAKKGGLFLLENALKSNIQDSFHFMIVGDIEAEMQNWLDQHAEQLNFSRLPFLDRFELLAKYPACDLIGIPSHYDGMPNVLLEAGALGIPVIAARVGGIVDVIPDALQPLTFHPGDAHGCQQTLWNISRLKQEQLRALGEALQNRIKQDFTATRENNSYLQLFTADSRKEINP